jgi:hypothetical protein
MVYCVQMGYLGPYVLPEDFDTWLVVHIAPTLALSS